MKVINYLVNDMFETIQGEAKYTGTASYFIRLQCCPVGCGWCDTKFTWYLDDNNKVNNQIEIINKDQENDKYAKFSAQDIYNVVSKGTAKHIVVTGGEPCLWPLHDLCNIFTENNYTVQIETSGTFPIDAPDNVWVTLSPKINMPGGYKIKREAVARCNEIKYPVGKEKDIQVLNDFLNEFSEEIKDKEIWLQPLSQSKKATLLCVAESIKNNWRISVQTHKYIDQK